MTGALDRPWRTPLTRLTVEARQVITMASRIIEKCISCQCSTFNKASFSMHLSSSNALATRQRFEPRKHSVGGQGGLQRRLFPSTWAAAVRHRATRVLYRIRRPDTGGSTVLPRHQGSRLHLVHVNPKHTGLDMETSRSENRVWVPSTSSIPICS